MKFADLLALPIEVTVFNPEARPSQSAPIDPDALADALPDTPAEVREQVFAEHGRKDEFQMQYGHLDLPRFNWQAEQLPASEIIGCGVFRDFRDIVSKAADRA
jgi:hypothetical protein